jgi:hypothetical protein
VSSGLAEVAVSTFNQVQRMNEVLTRLDAKLPDAGASPNQDGDVQRMLADAVQRAREAEWRAQEAERRLTEAPIQSAPDPVKVEPVAEEKMIVEETPIKEEVNVEAIIQAAVIAQGYPSVRDSDGDVPACPEAAGGEERAEARASSGAKQGPKQGVKET